MPDGCAQGCAAPGLCDSDKAGRPSSYWLAIPLALACVAGPPAGAGGRHQGGVMRTGQRVAHSPDCRRWLRGLVVRDGVGGDSCPRPAGPALTRGRWAGTRQRGVQNRRSHSSIGVLALTLLGEESRAYESSEGNARMLRTCLAAPERGEWRSSTNAFFP